jgi:ribulose-phosphate 3-epimerase
MSIICPTITTETKNEYDLQLAQAIKLAQRIHIDCSDGTLAPRKLLDIGDLSWPEDVQVDIHLMSINPNIELYTKKTQKISLVILHCEANTDFLWAARQFHSLGIKFGLAVLETTSIQTLQTVLKELDHVLIFSGNLGYQGGSTANLDLLEKISWLRLNKPHLEIGWDGGVNEDNIAQLVKGKVDVLNVGGYIQHSANPKQAYAKLKAKLEE